MNIGKDRLWQRHNVPSTVCQKHQERRSIDPATLQAMAFLSWMINNWWTAFFLCPTARRWSGVLVVMASRCSWIRLLCEKTKHKNMANNYIVVILHTHKKISFHVYVQYLTVHVCDHVLQNQGSLRKTSLKKTLNTIRICL